MALQSNSDDLSAVDDPGILIILKGVNYTDYNLSVRNDSLLWCKTYGDMMGYTFDGFVFENDTLEVSQAGGSSGRWGFKYYFVFDDKTDNWFIVKKYSFSYNSNNPEESFEDSTIVYNPKINI